MKKDVSTTSVRLTAETLIEANSLFTTPYDTLRKNNQIPDEKSLIIDYGIFFGGAVSEQINFPTGGYTVIDH